MSSHPIVLHIQMIDHLNHDLTQSYELSALYHHHPRTLGYTETDKTTKVDFVIGASTLSLNRCAAWLTQITFNLNGLGSFRVQSESGEMHGLVKLIESHIETHRILIHYQLILADSVITQQTVIYTIRGAQA